MTYTQILIHEMSFNFTTETSLFTKLNLSFSRQKIGLVGNNGCGKSTLIKLIAGDLHPHSGFIHVNAKTAYVAQNPIFSSDMTVAKILGYDEKLSALQRIEQGSIDLIDFSILNDDWSIKDTLQKTLNKFNLDTITPYAKVNMLSGGQTTLLLLTKAFSSDADLLLLDEPSNHLDQTARQLFYDAIQQWHGGLILASHDKSLLNLMDEIIEISPLGVSSFGGNYDAYRKHKEILIHSRQNEFNEAKVHLENTKLSIQLSKEKHEQRQAKGRKLRKSGSHPKMLLDAMENHSTTFQGSLSIQHGNMLDSAQNKLQLAKEKLESVDRLNIPLPKTYVPNGKIILDIRNLTFSYSESDSPLIQDFNLMIQGPERISLCGCNGSGKTTLVQLILNALKSKENSTLNEMIYLGTENINYLDQNSSLLKSEYSVLDNFLLLNNQATENEAYQALARFLFKNASAHKLVAHLSGGEKIRALLACTLMSKHPPQLLILDEPTNHIDINSMESIVSALKDYQGAMLVISHDQNFINAIGIERIIYAPFKSAN